MIYCFPETGKIPRCTIHQPDDLSLCICMCGYLLLLYHYCFVWAVSGPSFCLSFGTCFRYLRTVLRFDGF